MSATEVQIALVCLVLGMIEGVILRDWWAAKREVSLVKRFNRVQAKEAVLGRKK